MADPNVTHPPDCAWHYDWHACNCGAFDTIDVGPDHPAWVGIDDDDWNGATFTNWLETVRGRHIRLTAPKAAESNLVNRMTEALRRVGANVID